MSQIKKGLHYDPPKPDIDDILRTYITTEGLIVDEIWSLVAKEKTATYHRLAAEAVWVFITGEDHKYRDNLIKALPITKLKAIMEIKES